ncbi:MAG: hypothetical protein WA892_00040 [Ornithinimicrobium sp.]
MVSWVLGAIGSWMQVVGGAIDALSVGIGLLLSAAFLVMDSVYLSPRARVMVSRS